MVHPLVTTIDVFPWVEKSGDCESVTLEFDLENVAMK